VTGEQLANLRKVKESRDQRAVDAALERVRNAAADPNANTMPALIEAVKAYATVGEVSDAIRQVFGTYQEPALF
jgi:methylmalonyl-CoA mutase N-terminal domain/subunit